MCIAAMLPEQKHPRLWQARTRTIGANADAGYSSPASLALGRRARGRLGALAALGPCFLAARPVPALLPAARRLVAVFLVLPRPPRLLRAGWPLAPLSAA